MDNILISILQDDLLLVYPPVLEHVRIITFISAALESKNFSLSQLFFQCCEIKITNEHRVIFELLSLGLTKDFKSLS